MFKQNSENRALIYNILLAVFAILMVVLVLFQGPPPPAQTSAIATSSVDQTYEVLGVTPAQIKWYVIRANDVEQTVELERDGSGGWSRRGTSQEMVDVQLAEFGAQVLASFRVQRLVQFGPDDSLVQYGLTASPQYVVSFGVEAYNGADIETFTMYFGTLTPDQQEYYTVFVDETGPGQPRRQGEWVYLIEAGYVNALVNLMSTILDGQTPPEQLTPTLESVP